MYMGFLAGMLGGGLAVAIALLIAKRRGVAPLVEEDERTEQIGVRAGNLTFWAMGIFSFVGWVTDNVMRHFKDLPVAFFSPWSIIFFASVVVYAAAWYYESWKVSDNESAPDDKEMKKLHLVLVSLGASLTMISSAFVSAGSRMERSVAVFLIGFELLLALLTTVVLGQMYRRRRKARS
jgi:uncharacterized membrane protein